MTKKEILDYITETPGNTNRAVLGDMLDSFGGGSGGGDNSPYIVDIHYGEKNGRNASLFSKTFKEVYDAFMAGKIVLLSYPLEEDGYPAGSYKFYYVIGIEYNGENYGVSTSDGSDSYSADDYNDFPYLVVV